MISFPCNNCREELSVPADLAGGEIQCPRCGWLASVPLLSDLPNLQPDGTLVVGPAVRYEDAGRLETLARVFGKRRVDDNGELIDNRSLPEAVPLAPPPPPPRAAPRYDPETGERLDPLAVKRPTPVAAVPLDPLDPSARREGPPSLGYAVPGETTYLPKTSVWMELFQPANMTVLVIVWLAHLCGTIVDFFVRYLLAGIATLGGPDIPAWPLNLLFWVVAAHYANVVYETGEEEREVLPRLFRNGSFSEDLFLPLVRILAAFVVAYGPMAVLMVAAPDVLPARLTLAVALIGGGVVFPAALLNACGSASIVNLRPDRLLRVISVCGFPYWRLAGLTILVVPLYLWIGLGIQVIDALIGGTAVGNFTAGLAARGLIALPGLTLCVYAAHGICWRLGQLQRRHHQQFRWAWDEHEKERQAERQRRQAERAARARKLPAQ